MKYVEIELLRDVYCGPYHNYEKGDLFTIPLHEAECLVEIGLAKIVRADICPQCNEPFQQCRFCKEEPKMRKEHFDLMEQIAFGATIWDREEAKLIREIEQYDPELIEIIPVEELEKITGERYDGAQQIPYFGAILTAKGWNLL